MAQINKGTTYSAGNPTVTIDNLNAHVDNATLLVGAITEQTSITTAQINSLSSAQVILETGLALRRATLNQAVTGALSGTTNGQLLIGSTATSQFSKATLTAGSGISVTNGAASITLSTIPFASYSAPAAYSGTQTIAIPALTSLSGYFKYSLNTGAVITVKLPNTSKQGVLFAFKSTFLGNATIKFQASGSTTDIATATATTGAQEFTIIALQDNPTLPTHWGLF